MSFEENTLLFGADPMPRIVAIELGETGTVRVYRRQKDGATGVDVEPLLHTLVATTEEVDYSETLDYFGLRFSGGDDPKNAWMLEIRPDATSDQTTRLNALLARSEGPKR